MKKENNLINLLYVKKHHSCLNYTSSSHLGFKYNELDKDDYSLSTIGTPTVVSQRGQNKLILSYREPQWLLVAVLTPLVVLGMIALQWLYTKIRIHKVA